jgi:hypothetical protein
VKGHAEFVDGKADQISGIVAQDERTLVMTLTKPDVTIMGVVGIPPFYVLPREEVEAFGEDWPQNPVGTGPFKLKSWDNGQRVVTFEKYEDYVFGPELPYLDEVEYRYGVSDDVAFLTVARNEADLALNVPASAIPRIKENAEQSERFKEWGSYTLSYWQFDVSKPPFDDVRVRQAVNHAFNRERTEALGYVADGHFYPAGLIGYNESAEVFAYDPDRARELLAEAGVSDGDISFTMPVFGTNVAPRLSQLLQADLKEVGIEVELEQLDLTPYDIGAELPEKYPCGAWLGDGAPGPFGADLLARRHRGAVQLRRLRQPPHRRARRPGHLGGRPRRPRSLVRRDRVNSPGRRGVPVFGTSRHRASPRRRLRTSPTSRAADLLGPLLEVRGLRFDGRDRGVRHRRRRGCPRPAAAPVVPAGRPGARLGHHRVLASLRAVPDAVHRRRPHGDLRRGDHAPW